MLNQTEIIIELDKFKELVRNFGGYDPKFNSYLYFAVTCEAALVLRNVDIDCEEIDILITNKELFNYLSGIDLPEHIKIHMTKGWGSTIIHAFQVATTRKAIDDMHKKIILETL